MLPLIYTNASAAFVFMLAYLIWVIPEMLGNRRQMSGVSRKGATGDDRGSMALLISLQWIGVVLNFALAWLWPAAAIRWHPTAIFVLGIIFVLLGVALRWYSIRILGEYFTRDVAVSAGQQVVERGPYRLIRHPAYSGTFLTMLGVGLAMTNWASLICLLACVFAGHYLQGPRRGAGAPRRAGAAVRGLHAAHKAFHPVGDLGADERT